MAMLAVRARTPTFATSSAVSSASRVQPGRMRGFTLVELLVVFALAALLLGLAPMAYERARDAFAYRDATRRIVSELRQTRQSAVEAGAPVRFVLDFQRRTFGAEGKAEQDWPPKLDIRATVADREVQSGSAAILFLPTGGSTGGTLEVLRGNGAGSRVQIDWLTGRITVETIQP